MFPRFLVLALLASAALADDYGSSTASPVVPPPQPGPVYLQLAPMLGHVGPTEARIWVKATGAAKLAVRVSERADMDGAREIAGPEIKAASDFTGVVVVPELKARTTYFYTVLLDGQPALARPWPSFTTAPADGAKGRLRFAFGSCAGKEPWLDAATWADLEARTSVDLVLQLGDNHYANTTDPAKQRAAFIAHRSHAGFRALFQHTPLYAVWDDHDFGVNDSDGTQKGKEDSLRTFSEFFANPAAGEPDNSGVYFKFSRGDVDFFLLDDRYHRSPDKVPDDGTKTQLGAKQLAWLKRELLASKATLRVIACGGEWQGDSVADSWKSYAREEQEIFDFLAEHGIKNVLLLSGDRHFTAAYHVRGRFIEVTSGPLGSPGAKSRPSPEMFAYHDGGRFFSIYDIDTAATPPAVALEIWQTSIGLVEKRAFTWEQVTGGAKIEPRLPGSSTSHTESQQPKTKP
ncbi:MAG: alkaline phosphatase D family protein [Chthoniobacter sp.]|nr:alkaline phosphatase D family protein [Chthoniobacter sp.]